MTLSDATEIRNIEEAKADLRSRINADREAVITATLKQYPQIGVLQGDTMKFYAYINGVYAEGRFITSIVRNIEAAKAASARPSPEYQVEVSRWAMAVFSHAQEGYRTGNITDAQFIAAQDQFYQDYLDVCDRINKCRDLYEIRNLGYESQKMIKVLVALGKLPESAL